MIHLFDFHKYFIYLFFSADAWNFSWSFSLSNAHFYSIVYESGTELCYKTRLKMKCVWNLKWTLIISRIKTRELNIQLNITQRIQHHLFAIKWEYYSMRQEKILVKLWTTFSKKSKMFLFLFSHLNSIALTSKFKMRKRTKSIELNKEKENNLKKKTLQLFQRQQFNFL